MLKNVRTERFCRERLLLRIGSTAGAFAFVRAAARGAQFEYKSGHVQAPDAPMHLAQVQLWSQVEKETNGRLVVKVYPASQLGSQTSLFSQMREGAIDMLSVGNDVYSSVVASAAIDAIGFAFKDNRTAWSVVNGPVGDFVRKEFTAKGMYVPKGALWDQGMSQLSSSSRPIRTADDLLGFKLRVAPSNTLVDLFRTLGASPVALSATEAYTAMQTHLVDGQANGYVAIQSQRLWEVQKYLSETNHAWGGAWYVINGKAWAALPADIQAVVERNAAKYALMMHNDGLQRTVTAKADLLRRGMVANVANSATMRLRLPPYYVRSKAAFGGALWDLLESNVGKLG